VVIKAMLTKYDILKAKCPKCGTTSEGTPPAECKGTVNYGHTIKALSVVLTQYADVGIDKTHKILQDIVGVPISAATIQKSQKEFAGKTAESIEHIKARLLKSPILHVDETGMRVTGKTQWVHVASNSQYTLINVHEKRGKQGSDSGGVLPEYKGVMIHDCWTPYFKFDSCDHALCCAHLLRELNAIIEGGQLWAIDMKALLLEMKKVTERYKEGEKTELSYYYLTKFKTLYDSILSRGKAENPPKAERKKSKAENLLRRLEEYQREITRFTTQFFVPFDNNQAERDIRTIKVKQKVSGGFRTVSGAQDFANTLSVIGTAVKFGQSVFFSVRDLFDGVSPSFVLATE
jgi:transposase